MGDPPLQSRSPRKAALILVGATFFWAASFPLMKALARHQEALAPGVNPLFLAAVSVLARFGLSALLLAAWHGRGLGGFTRLEMGQGAGLGFFGGIGILLQMDALDSIPASTSAFLTQCYCIFVPAFLACQRRVWPAKTLALSCGLVLVGVAELARFDWSQFRLGRGETETILASIFFTGQILWLERPVYAMNRAGPVTLLMFALVAALLLPVAVLTSHNAGEWRAVYSSCPALAMTGFMAVACTLVPYTLMNHWQPLLPASHASLIYAAEPLITSVFALFVPLWLSRWAGIEYANETLSGHLLFGGSLITAANLLVLWPARRPPKIKGPVTQ